MKHLFNHRSYFSFVFYRRRRRRRCRCRLKKTSDRNKRKKRKSESIYKFLNDRQRRQSLDNCPTWRSATSSIHSTSCVELQFFRTLDGCTLARDLLKRGPTWFSHASTITFSGTKIINVLLHKLHSKRSPWQELKRMNFFSVDGDCWDSEFSEC